MMDEWSPERHARLAKWIEMTDKIEAIIREYGDILHDTDEYDEEIWGAPPDWKNPISLTDWCLVLGVEDLSQDATIRGHWLLHVEPWNQLPYRTRGLLESGLDDLP